MSKSFDRFLDAAFVQMMLEIPELPTHMGIFDANGVACPQDRFSGVGEDHNRRRIQLLRDLLVQLQSFLDDGLAPAQRISAKVFEFFLRNAQELDWLGTDGANFIDHKSPLRPSVGLQTELPLFLAERHPFRHAQNAEDYVSRVKQIPQLLADAAGYVQRQHKKAIGLPGFLIDDTLNEIAAFIATDLSVNPICTTFEQKAADLTDLSAHGRALLGDEIRRCLVDEVYPAYAATAAVLRKQRANAGEAPGLWALPDGAAYYDFLLKGATTTALTAEVIHTLGLEHVAAMHREIASHFKRLGFEEATIADCYRRLERTRITLLADTETSRMELLAEARALHAQVLMQLPEWFKHIPRARSVIEPLPTFAEQSRNHSYHPPAADGSRPGIFELNLKHLMMASDRNLATLVYHELVPGHHLQLSLALENETLPLLRRIITFDAYIEGWAKYAETLPGEQGIQQSDTQRLLNLRAELISTVNLVLDTGIHAKRWSREHAIDYFEQQTGMPKGFATYVAHRSAAVPAQLCSYKIGLLKMRELKARQQQQLGLRFDLKEFHDRILSNGALPLAVLDEVFAQTPANRSDA